MAAMDHGEEMVEDEYAPAATPPIGALDPTVISIMETGRRLRSTLKDHYPDVRFKVRVTRGMEQSIAIEWTSGPLADEVVPIARTYIGPGYHRDDLRGDGDGGDAAVSGYDVSRIEVCRLKADGSVDTSRVMRTNEIE